MNFLQAAKSRSSLVSHRRRPTRSVWSERLQYAFDGGGLLVLLVVPLLMGGRHPAGRLAYEVTVCWMAACWLIRNCIRREAFWRFSGLEWLWLAALAIIVAQLIPLPLAVLDFLSPYQRQLLPTWFPSDGAAPLMGQWTTLSLAPLATRNGLVMFVAHATLFTLLLQRMDRLEDVEKLLRGIAIAVVSMASIGLLQYFSGTEQFVWVFQHPTRDASRIVTGPFENANHFAHFLTLGLGVLLVLLHESLKKPDRRFTRHTAASKQGMNQRELAIFGLAFAIGIVAIAIVLSQSRGGMLVAFAASMSCFVILAMSRMIGYRSFVACGVIGAIVLGAVYLHGHERIQSELETLVEGSWDEIDRGAVRWKLWQANLEIARRFPIAGAGVGSHADLYEVFFPYKFDTSFLYAESGYLQVLTEAGLPGLGLLCIAGVYFVRQALTVWRRHLSARFISCLAAIVAGFVASVVHSIFDFPWYIPCCMGLTMMLLASLTRLSQLSHGDAAVPAESRSIPRMARIQFAAVWLLLLLVLTWTQVPAARAARAWNNYLKVSLAEDTMGLAEYSKVGDLAFGERRKRENGDRTRLMARYLQQVLAYDQSDSRAHSRMAYQCVRIFEELQMRGENAIDLGSLSDAALASQFPDLASQDRWLRAAIGDNRRWLDLAQYHVYQTLRTSPLQGKMYLYLTHLGFLQGINREGVMRILDQAYRVSPHDSSVLFGMGREAVMSRNIVAGIDYWKLAFHQGDEHREQIIMALAGPLTAKEFIDCFQPDEEGIRMLFAYYRGADLDEQAKEIAPLLAKRQCERASKLNGRDAACMWERAQATFRYLENDEQSLRCAQQAAEAAPLRYQSRFLLAQELLRNSQWRDAIDAIDWCLLRRPDDEMLHRMHRAASRELAEGVMARSTSATTGTDRK